MLLASISLGRRGAERPGQRESPFWPWERIEVGDLRVGGDRGGARAGQRAPAARTMPRRWLWSRQANKAGRRGGRPFREDKGARKEGGERAGWGLGKR